MKKTAMLMALSVSAVALNTGSAAADYTLDILHINDLHSRIEPINRFDSTCSADYEAEGKCFGGVARVKAKIDERRAALTDEGGNVLVLDAGDQFQGSLFYTTYKGKDTVEFMNAIGYDAMSLGNHEFDDGPDGTMILLDGAKMPVMSGLACSMFCATARASARSRERLTIRTSAPASTRAPRPARRPHAA